MQGAHTHAALCLRRRPPSCHVLSYPLVHCARLVKVASIRLRAPALERFIVKGCKGLGLLRLEAASNLVCLDVRGCDSLRSVLPMRLAPPPPLALRKAGLQSGREGPKGAMSALQREEPRSG